MWRNNYFATGTGSQGQGLSVVSRGMGGHSSGGFFLAQGEHGVRGTPELEGTHLLEIFALEEKLGPGHGIEARACKDRGAMSVRADTLGRSQDILQIRSFRCLINGYIVGGHGGSSLHHGGWSGKEPGCI